jgi:hypothetical protein
MFASNKQKQNTLAKSTRRYFFYLNCLKEWGLWEQCGAYGSEWMKLLF